MRKLNHAILAATAFVSASCSVKEMPANLQTIPLPQEVVINQEAPFLIQISTKILYPEGDELLKRNATFLSDYIQEATGYKPAVETTPANGVQDAIVLGLNEGISQNEGYELNVNSKQVSIQGKTANGVF